MSVCRSCGQKIHWIELKSGKKMPCDMEIITPAEAEPGDVLVSLDGEVLKVPADGILHSQILSFEGYVSHFATCPQADEWRKDK